MFSFWHSFSFYWNVIMSRPDNRNSLQLGPQFSSSCCTYGLIRGMHPKISIFQFISSFLIWNQISTYPHTNANFPLISLLFWSCCHMVSVRRSLSNGHKSRKRDPFLRFHPFHSQWKIVSMHNIVFQWPNS